MTPFMTPFSIQGDLSEKCKLKQVLKLWSQNIYELLNTTVWVEINEY